MQSFVYEGSVGVTLLRATAAFAAADAARRQCSNATTASSISTHEIASFTNADEATSSSVCSRACSRTASSKRRGRSSSLDEPASRRFHFPSATCQVRRKFVNESEVSPRQAHRVTLIKQRDAPIFCARVHARLAPRSCLACRLKVRK
jgi:hypothetical protein